MWNVAVVPTHVLQTLADTSEGTVEKISGEVAMVVVRWGHDPCSFDLWGDIVPYFLIGKVLGGSS